MKHLCLIIDRCTFKVYAEYEIEAIDWYYARNIALRLYEQSPEFNKAIDYCVDSMEI